MAWFPANPGSMSGIAIAGYGFGSVIWNPLETEYVNPENISPEEAADGSEDRYSERDSPPKKYILNFYISMLDTLPTRIYWTGSRSYFLFWVPFSS